MTRNALSFFAFLLAVASLVFLLAIHHLLASNPFLIAVQVGAVLLMVWARLTFGLRSFHATASTTRGELVTEGPYRFWRHPIYVSIIYFVWAGQVQSPSAASIVGAVVVTLSLFARMVLEERVLLATYAGYAEYARRTKRFIPFVI